MEHDVEKIRAKIFQAEENEVAWNKELIWSGIDRGAARRSYVFYYAAASLVLAASVFFYLYQRNAEQKLQLQIAQLEHAIEQEKSSLQKANNVSEVPSCIESPAGKITTAQSTPRKNKKETLSKPKEVTASPLIKDGEKEMLVATAVDESEQQIILPEIVEIPTVKAVRKVEAIIGGDHLRQSMLKDKRLKFSLLTPEEEPETNPAAAEKVLVISRIN